MDRQQAIKRKTIQALPGRTHTVVQTEPHLDVVTNVINRVDMDSQTDPFLDRSTSPLFTFNKTGRDFETETDEGQLSDFDVDVKLLLDVLVEKTIEQSLVEVMEEEELAMVGAQQRAFIELRNYELAELKRLEEREKRRQLEKERRHAQLREVLRKEGDLSQKMAAQAYTQQYISELFKIATAPPITPEKDIQSNFMPWLIYRINSLLEMRTAARQLLDSIIVGMAQQSLDEWNELKEQTAK